MFLDSVLDDCLKGHSDSRAVCEVLATKGRVIVAGEIIGRRNPDMSEIVKEVLEYVGYSPEGIQIDAYLHRQFSESMVNWLIGLIEKIPHAQKVFKDMKKKYLT